MKVQRTRSQEKIIQVLQSLEKAISAQDLYLEMRNRDDHIGLATIYRSLEALKLQGELKVRKLANGESVYSSVKKDRHHLTCLNCGISIPIEECPVHTLERQLEQSHQFKVYYHTLEFFGICDRCQIAQEA